MKTDDLIGLLARDAPVSHRYSTQLTAAVAGGTIVAALLFAASFSVRADLAQMAGTPRVVFKFAFVLLVGMAAFGTVRAIGRPGVAWRPWGVALVAAIVLLGLAMATELAVSPPSDWVPLLLGHNAAWCVATVPLLSAVPLACLLVALRQGAPHNPGLAGAAAGLCASGIGAGLYALHCVDDSPLFIAAWYGLATLIVMAAGFAIGRSWLRW